MDLTGKILIAMPAMGDPRFEHSVVLICAHSPEGAMGLIVNKSAPGLASSELFEQLSIRVQSPAATLPVHFGGPVETGRGFVLHSPDWPAPAPEASLNLSAEIAMTATRDILEDIAAGHGPKQAFLALGYAGWGAGQLESEILANGWLTADADAELIFSTANARKWQMALHALGVDPVSLSATAGRA
jgi:putative transcriptional regulator